MDKRVDIGTSIGSYIKETVIPKNMSVKAAAEILGVGRPALSNLLNNRASLSADMAARMERAFGISARDLLDMQAEYKTKSSKEKGITASTRAYVPPFMQFKANDIEEWASNIKARTRFAVFLRTLINSTGLKIKSIDFPGNDDAERPGWDGFLETEEGTPWIPAGLSGWEFGTNKEPKKKADKDFNKSVEQNTLAVRLETTFVFVTPIRWHGKDKWRKERQEENKWKEVLVFDSSDLEQWVEQSIPGQAWLANEMGVSAEGVISLDECWRRWVVDTDPQLSQNFFDPIVEKSKNIVLEKLTIWEPITIASDSNDEALAYVYSLFSCNDLDLTRFRDRIAVFTKPGVLSKLAAKPSDFIAVITNREVEHELAPLKKNLRSIILYPRGATNAEVDVTLEPLIYEHFSNGLETMGYNRDQIMRLSHESGRSLTVLRRRLSNLEAIRTPEWASDKEIVTTLKNFVFAGAWETRNESDRLILSLLASDVEYENLEDQFVDLISSNNSPVWSIGHMRGLVSKMDALYAINRRISSGDIERFLHVAYLVLSEDDPSLDLPENKRWAANIYGKTREISSTLRKGISETLVLLAVHGNSLFLERTGNHISSKIEMLVRSLLSPLTTRKLEAQSEDLPLYAEAAPEMFLQILEDDLSADAPQSLDLMRPVDSGIFGRNPRTGLLWALESLAWSPEYLMRVVKILAELSKREIEDNWVNKPGETLKSIFRCWMPQTAASFEERISAFEYLVREYPEISWSLCLEQFNGQSKIGSFSYKPRWRSEAHGAGEPVGGNERYGFSKVALEFALNWEKYTVNMLCDLVSCMRNIPKKSQECIWDIIENWGATASESEKSILREKVRTSVLVHQSSLNNVKGGDDERATIIFNNLEPNNIILRHEWLFKNLWVDESFIELFDDNLDYEGRSRRIETLRLEALTAIKSELGLQGILEIAGRGECARIIGELLTDMITDQQEIRKLVDEILSVCSFEDSPICKSVVSGIFRGIVSQGKVGLLSQIINKRKPSNAVSLLIQAPFVKNVWEIVEDLEATVQVEYWKKITPQWLGHADQEEIHYAIDQLIRVDRPRAAFKNIQYNLKAIPPKLLFRLVSAIASIQSEPEGNYMLDSYHVVKALKCLTDSGEITVDKMAELEFQFIDAFSREEDTIPNLEKHLEDNPELFVQAIVMAYKRDDGNEDPIEFRPKNQHVKEQLANAAFQLLDKLSFIPGHNSEGELDSELIIKWVKKVRQLSLELSRKDICDVCIGNLFSKAPIGEDGIWPCQPVRIALNNILNDRISRGLMTGMYNSRGAHWRKNGGDDERILAAKYETWAKALEFSYPQVAAFLKRMEKSYMTDAVEEDYRAKVEKRLLY
ncbi:HigA family addiction module antitoxin [Alteribacter keqinensis]|uniref:Addiction module antidote protein, HigA family n=1 Tax=Alteribacter keqinensis TaxID=2483800 RepID=A0A3M7TLZ8_9BACI|nr:HigA family addiction module antitoxin [Alteribacter keqinensis]RNA66210.1 addiction module antidote protein, HigA family [Alteribacter keqinensis]